MGNSCDYEGNEPFKKFKSVASLELKEPLSQYSVREWYKNVSGEDNESLPNEKLSRADVKAVCGDKSRSDSDCLRWILAWGCSTPFDIANDEHFFSTDGAEEHAISVIKELRDGLPSLEAYDNFYDLKDKGKNKIKGLGVAFYTKLIFFCNPNHDGYIMDQFASKAVNLIMDKKIVRLEENLNKKNNKCEYVVSGNNKRCNYKNFCIAIDCLSRSLGGGRTGGMVEMYLHSHPEWRKHVDDNYDEAKSNFAESEPCCCKGGE